jgi:hypothetical protein
MTSVEAASALLTAESIVIAAVALASRHVVRTSLKAEIREQLLHLAGLLTTLFTAVSFGASLGYLHVAEYPSGVVASTAGAETVFTLAILSLLGLLYIGLVLLMIVSVKLLVGVTDI